MASEKGELISKDKIPVEVGLPSPTQSARWWKNQVKYKNFAGVNPALDLVARTTVINRREQFRSKMSGPMRRWAVNWAAANTEVMWQEREDDIHMPETKKALDGKVARVEEAVVGFDPVFEAEGVKGDVSRRTAKVIGNFVYRKMEMADWKRFVQPLAKDGELCNVMAIKVQWDKRIEDMVERSDELAFNKRGEPEYHTQRRMRKVVARDGVKLTQVDPFWFIYDLEADTAQECAYIGDESLVFMHELNLASTRSPRSHRSRRTRTAATRRTSQTAPSDPTTSTNCVACGRSRTTRTTQKRSADLVAQTASA